MTRKTLSLLAAGLILSLSAQDAAAHPGPRPIRERIPSGFMTVDGVNTRNGNFAVTYPAFEGSSGVPYRRTYNSLSANPGLFGRGWGSSFETRLVALPDGRRVVIENGNGALTRYGAPAAGESRADFERAVALALERADAPERNGLGRALAAAGRWFRPANRPARLVIDPASTFADEVCSAARIETSGSGWRRTQCDGQVQTFDARGRLAAYGSAEAPLAVRLTRTGSRLDRVRLGDGRRLVLTRRGAAVTVTSEAGDWIAYAFDAQGRNVGVTSAKDAPLVFGYDDGGRLVDIGFVDTTHRRVAYNRDGRVAEVLGRNGESTSFIYRTEPDGRLETEVSRVATSGAMTETIYEMKD